MENISIIVTGKVQGVFFRASAKEAADQLNINGFAQNMPNGSVHIEAEGAEEKLKQFVDWCHKGPPRAQGTRVYVQEGDVKNFERFKIMR
jgi:acylphosphatase